MVWRTAFPTAEYIGKPSLVKRGSTLSISDPICVWFRMSGDRLLRSVVIGVIGGLSLVTPLRAQTVYHGRTGTTTVAIPRATDPVTIDGVLDEPAWSTAALLTGFSQFNPTDGRPAVDSTEALVWYGPDAIYFAVRAYAPEGTVRATLADRDRIQNDDHVQFILDTFNDRRQAYVFAVNPLGVQSDGIRTEGGGGPGRGRGGSGGGGGGGSFSRAGLGNADLNQDLIWQSKGQLTPFGYQVELRIPYKSIRFRSGGPLTWGLNVVRQTQRNNYQDTWTMTKRGLVSFLIQSGRLEGIRDLQRGLVLDLTPVYTAFAPGAEDTTGAWRYGAAGEAGADIRWGLTPSLTMNATINPDFSQVEADAGQIPGDVRFAVLFPELRPFFVEGSEQFDTPNQLVYTRQIGQPIAASKLTGKVSRFDVGVLTAIDNPAYSASGVDNPLFTIGRLRRDVGTQSNIGFTLTDRREGGNDFNQVLNADGRFNLRDVYSLSYQLAHARSVEDQAATDGSLWEFSFDRSGRSWGFRNTLEGVSPGFDSRSGFIPRTDYARMEANQRYSWFGARGARVEQVTAFLTGQGTWAYRNFFDQDRPLEHRLSLWTNVQFRGGWNMSLTPSREGFGFLPSQYERYYVERRSGGVVTDTVKYTPTGRVEGRQLSLRFSTPQFRTFGLSAGTTFGRDVEFLEGSQARRLDYNVSLDLRPTPQLRMSVVMLHQEFRRARDRSVILKTDIPRLRMEYQLSRAIFFRFVGQYEARTRDAYRDPTTEEAILFRDADDGSFARAEASRTNRLRADWLFSYFPSPGRVLFLGYGASLEEPEAFRFRTVERTRDGFFVKFSWLYRVP